MRVVLKLEPQGKGLTLPLHYNHLVQAVIYQSLDDVLARWLHGEGFRCGKRRFKMFTFSRLMSKDRSLNLKEKTITFHGPVLLKIGSIEDQVLESIALQLVRKREIKMNGQLCRFFSIEVEMPVKPKGPEVVRALSPVTVRRTLVLSGRRKTRYYSPWEEEFSFLIMENLQRKALALYGSKEDLPSMESAWIRPLRVSKENEAVVNFKGFWIKGWMGFYEVNLPEPYFTLGYHSGLGSRNSQGFGMVEVVRKRMAERLRKHSYG